MLVAVNMRLGDFIAANGATEIWPGSHLLANAEQEERRTLLALVYYRQYAMPDNLVALTEPISTSDWLQLSERMRWTYRLTRTQTK